MLTTQMLTGLEERTHAIPCFTKACNQYMLSIASVLSCLNISIKIIVKALFGEKERTYKSGKIARERNICWFTSVLYAGQITPSLPTPKGIFSLLS